MKETLHSEKFHVRVQELLETSLPEPGRLISEGKEIARNLKIGRSLFCEQMGVSSELEYKMHCMQNNRIMYHAHIGMGSWMATAQALRHIAGVSKSDGYRIDRAGICLDRRMSVPAEQRQDIPAETGPLLVNKEDWDGIAQTAPIQPHMGDFMIGFPASTANTVNALRVGVTTIGNLSQYFSHEAPMWDDPVTTVMETVRAIAILGQRSGDGILFHSYLEDGFGALFQDCATIAGWAYLERYIVEDLLGARLTHCIGGLTSDPVKRVGWVFALREIHSGELVGSMIYGDTISITQNFPRNWGIVGEYLLWDILAQMECPTGHAVHPLPITEAVRIPTAEEIAEVHTFGRQVEATAKRLHPLVDFSPAQGFSDDIVLAGKKIFDRALDGLKGAGVDVSNPVQLLYILKQIGPYSFEATFGLGEWDEAVKRRKPLFPTDMFQQSLATIDQYLPHFQTDRIKSLVGKRRLLLASTDVHEHALFVLHELLHQAGAEVVYLGAEQDPVDVARAARSWDVDAVLVSTHNGMALEYAQRLKNELQREHLRVPVLMGGVLNQKFEDQVLPADVTGEIQKLGFQTNVRLDRGWGHLLPSGEE